MEKQRIIAVDFDGCLVTNEFPNIGEPIQKNIDRLKEEIKNGSKVILWTCRTDKKLEGALDFCRRHELKFDAVNDNIQEIKDSFDGEGRKIFATEYWDDRAVCVDEKDIGEFSDGYHTFNDLYVQRLILSAALFNTYPNLAWKSRRHSDGEECFGGGWFIVGIDTPHGPYTYHYENKHWDLFACPEFERAPKWDGHTDKDVTRLLYLPDPWDSEEAEIEKAPEEEKSSIGSWAEREIEIACARERAASGNEDEWDYGCACYESALKAFKSMLGDEPSGYSISVTKHILHRLIDGKPLTPIEDTDDMWNDISMDGGDCVLYQCKRMSSLFKRVYSDGRVEYNDNDSYYCVDLNNNCTYHTYVVRQLIDEMYPISMPYMPSEPMKVYCSDLLTDRKNGDFDTKAVWYLLKPDGTRININRFFKEGTNGWAEISLEEYIERQNLDLLSNIKNGIKKQITLEK